MSGWQFSGAVTTETQAAQAAEQAGKLGLITKEALSLGVFQAGGEPYGKIALAAAEAGRACACAVSHSADKAADGRQIYGYRYRYIFISQRQVAISNWDNDNNDDKKSGRQTAHLQNGGINNVVLPVDLVFWRLRAHNCFRGLCLPASASVSASADSRALNFSPVSVAY